MPTEVAPAPAQSPQVISKPPANTVVPNNANVQSPEFTGGEPTKTKSQRVKALGDIWSNAANNNNANEKPAEQAQPKQSEQQKQEAAPAATKEEAKPESVAKPDSVMDILQKSFGDKKEESKPEAAAEAKVEEVKPQETDKDKNFAALRKAKEELENNLKAIREEYEGFKKKLPADYEKKLGEYDTIVEALEKTNLELSPRFQEKYNKPMGNLLDSIKHSLKNTDVNSEAFVAMVLTPESKERNTALAHALGEMDEFTRTKIASNIAEFDRLGDQRKVELASPRRGLAEIQQEQMQQMELQKRQNAELFDGVVNDAIKSNMFWLQKREGMDEWNKAVDKAITDAKRMWNEPMDPRVLAKATLDAHVAPMAVKMLVEALEINKKLQEDMASLRGAKPRVNTPAPASGEAKGITPGKGSAVEAFKQAAGL